MANNESAPAIKVLVKINPAPLDDFFKGREECRYSRVTPPLFIRLDGVRFGKALRGYTSPRDLRVHNALIEAAKAIMTRFNALISYVVSDEINILMSDALPYGGRTFKLLSVTSSIASSHISLKLNIPLYFDSRIILLDNVKQAISYILYRARVGSNNYISSIYHQFIKDPETPSLTNMISKLKELGLMGNIKTWEIIGSCLSWEIYVKKGYDPISNKVVETMRRKITVHEGIENCIEIINRAGYIKQSTALPGLKGF